LTHVNFMGVLTMTAEQSVAAPVAAEDVARLAGQVAGPVLRPGDEDYAGEAAGFNLAFRHEPALIVGAANARDVQEAVRFAGAFGLPVAVAATGHGPSVAADGAVLITTGRMTGMTVDPARRVARVEAGVRWRQAVDQAAAAGLAPLCGSSPTVGVVGYTLGGGLSVTMSRARGWASDHVRSLDVVTADGELRHVSADSGADLFWALRGGKSNFGVVTAMEFALFPVTRLYAGGLFYSGAHTAAVLRAFRELTARAPDELTSSVALVRMPNRPDIPTFMRGTLSVNLRFSYLGGAAEGRELAAPLRAAAPALIDTLMEREYATFDVISPGGTVPASSFDRMVLLDDLTKETTDALVELAGPDADTPLTVIDIRQLGGALRARTGPPSAVRRPGAGFVLFALGQAPVEQADVIWDAGRTLLNGLRPWLSDRKHGNFLTAPDALSEPRSAFDEADYDRLREIKAAYDPGNMFRVNFNIPPRLPARRPGARRDAGAPVN
jgi:FAD/FMN-containing dehydrogenase